MQNPMVGCESYKGKKKIDKFAKKVGFSLQFASISLPHLSPSPFLVIARFA
jgi:hypothetical protein